MRIYLCCPECGGVDWETQCYPNGSLICYRCSDCGEFISNVDDMGAVTSEGEELY